MHCVGTAGAILAQPMDTSVRLSASLTTAVVGPYVLRELISAGGVAEVYRAQHRDDHKEYAVKVIRPERQSEKHHAKAFADEFDLLCRLDHPQIPKARRKDEVRGRACMVIDLVPGRTLHVLREENAGFDAFAAFRQIVAVTAYLHQQEIVHNDLKLENVILRPDGQIGLVDYGNARPVARKSLLHRLLKRKEPTFGTPTYLAPELISGEGEASFRSDVYSLGVCAFILLTGQPPFVYDRKSARLRAAVNQQAPSIRTRLPKLSPNLTRLIDSTLAKDPEHRPVDAIRLSEALRIVGAATQRVANSKTPLPADNAPAGPIDL